MSIPTVSIKQIKAALPTIKRLEAASGDLGGRPVTGEKIVAALEKAGVEFLHD